MELTPAPDPELESFKMFRVDRIVHWRAARIKKGSVKAAEME
jgi:hypothetical protein